MANTVVGLKISIKDTFNNKHTLHTLEVTTMGGVGQLLFDM